MIKPSDYIEHAVTPEVEAQRLSEYRRLGGEQRAMPHIVYHGIQVSCPWPGCGFRIAGIDFQLEKLNDAARYTEWLAAWWQGPGLVGRCPGCGQYVLFGMTEKRAVPDPSAFSVAPLPDDWYQTAYVI